jgi:hypothetical protein
LATIDISKIPEAASVKKLADAALADPMYWFGVRHHSPAAARFVKQAIVERKPKVIFLEAPSDAQSMLEHVVDAQTKPPVAIYSSFRDDDNRLGGRGIDSPASDVPAKYDSWYPLLSYSPEYVVMKVAAVMKIPVVFIDLPFSAQLRSHVSASSPDVRLPDDDEFDDEDDDDDRLAQPDLVPDATQRKVTRWDDTAITSRFYRMLAETGGYRSWDECWDSLFEVGLRHANADEFRRDMAYFCAALRATTAPERLASDDTLTREAHMWQTITSTLRQKKLQASDAMVVCGGFHLFLDRESSTAIPLVPDGTHFVTVAPFSYGRTSSQDGYGAGNRAPRYYERLLLGDDDLEPTMVAAMVDHIVAVLHRGRRSGEALSSADAISIAQHARMLANLRGRKLPALDDIRDAVITCCCKGDPRETGRGVQAAMTEVEIGTAVGRVTAALGKLPLVYDFYRLLDELDLGEIVAKDRRKKFTLDLREAIADRRSVFFHRLVQLGIPLARRVDEATSQLMFRETWTVEWSPKTDAALIEKNLHGDTVESAASSMLLEEVAAASNANAGEICDFLRRAVSLDLPQLFARLEPLAGQIIDDDVSTASLGQALTHLSVLQRQSQRKHLQPAVIADLIERAYARGCFALPYAANVPAEEHAAVITGMKAIAEVVLTQHQAADAVVRLDQELFVTNAKTAYRDSTNPYLRGAFAGVLSELRAHSSEDLAREVASFAGARGDVLAGCGDFLSGLVATSRTALMLGAEPLVNAIDHLLVAASWDDFMLLLPRARGAFEGMHDRSRVAIADRVATMYGLSAQEAETLATLPTSESAMRRLAQLDAAAEAIMQQWEFS